jgi:hypothetical protein
LCYGALVRERIIAAGKDEVVWGELQKQLDYLGLKVKRGMKGMQTH